MVVTFSSHGIIKGRHLVLSLDIKMAQISSKIVIFSWLNQNFTKTQRIFLFVSWNSAPSLLLLHQFSDIPWPINLPVSIVQPIHWKFLFLFEYSNFIFKGTQNVNSMQSLKILKMKLKLCQPTVCNKCKKIVYENYSRKHVKRCMRVLELEDCCDLTKYYNDSFFGWKY